MMLRHLMNTPRPTASNECVREVIKEGKKVTRDLNPDSGVGTKEMTQVIIDRIHASS